LLIVPESDEDRIACELSYDSTDGRSAAIIVSDHYSVITLQGSETAEVLAQACGIDLHPQEFSIGQCCRCAFARTTAIVRPLDSQGAYDLIVESSYAQYAEHWLSRAIGA
jgi:heterotetrameric sarcosine oxidase gamma subunit